MLTTHHYFSNALGTLEYLPDSYVYLRWSGKAPTSLELRALYIHARNLLERTNLCCLLVDHRALPAAFDAADQEWLLTRWLPETTAHTHCNRYAVLPALEPTHRLHTDPVIAKFRCYFSVALFEDLNQATAWLQTT
ncbi:hypothetical protein [Hymenobacter sp. GOD-10R]|uniref:hypothetical protein n=1 Tax=Hymenobacter sp. GOD-10R TaxID=3093922 RepID=UPI002D76C56D|nr:hypothetical protein [Hymenobacter sp. GOD-10R]WRQ27976.1 hypothetical protein SD425_23160 [Hymenobacter sp. GOD-10R]